MIRIGFWGTLCYSHNKELSKNSMIINGNKKRAMLLLVVQTSWD